VSIVAETQAATFQLSRTASVRLRRLTKTSGLSSENVVSRAAIVRSLQAPLDADWMERRADHDGKEMKGVTLLGRPRSAALLLGMVAAHAEDAPAPQHLDAPALRQLVRFHWERGLDLLAAELKEESLVDKTAASVLAKAGANSQGPNREVIAAAVGRRYGRWPQEVRRLAALAGRLDEAGAQETADRIARRAAELGVAERVSEAVALQIFAEWGLNRLGLNSHDRALLARIATAELDHEDQLRSSEMESLAFLRRLRLIRVDRLSLTEQARRAGDDLWRDL
jgi:DNA sulfur modification protein DndE